MAKKRSFNHPWLVAVWPGMGNVALNAGVLSARQTEMDLIPNMTPASCSTWTMSRSRTACIQPGERPRNRFYGWTDPEGKHDLVVLLGEAQPPVGKYPFCSQIIDYAREIGVERIITFAAMATQMHPEHSSRVFAPPPMRRACRNCGGSNWKCWKTATLAV